MKRFPLVSLAFALTATIALSACNKAGDTPATTSTTTPSSTMPPASAASR